jgi:uncharacterized SAM-binding protein YcdF (DUF218 family)
MLRLALRVSLVSIGIWAVVCITLGGLILWAGDRSTATRSDVIIVLGAGLRRDGSPGDALYRRSLWAARAYTEGLAPVIICTGGQSETQQRSEAEACRQLLLENGVPADAIVMEQTSRSTEENAINTHAIMQANGWQTAIVVTDAFHMLRASWIFDSYGIHFSQHPVPRTWVRWTWYTMGALREVVAMHWFLVKQTFNLPYTNFFF